MRQYNSHNLAGCVSKRKSRTTGAVVAVFHAGQAGLDSSAGDWVTSCETHGTICNHKTLADALRHAPHVNWCEYCTGGNHGE